MHYCNYKPCSSSGGPGSNNELWEVMTHYRTCSPPFFALEEAVNLDETGQEVTNAKPKEIADLLNNWLCLALLMIFDSNQYQK